jgi:hypothetical protein
MAHLPAQEHSTEKGVEKNFRQGFSGRLVRIGMLISNLQSMEKVFIFFPY